jgi:hypothetical protein
MIGNGHCRHFIFTGFFEEVFQANHSVEKAVLGMDM